MKSKVSKVVEAEPEQDIIELEEYYHEADPMCAISVIEHEISYLQLMCKKLKGDDLDFFKSKIESLEFSKQSLETNVSTGIITPDKYIKSVKVYKK
jgi:hypothetical protein